MRKIHYVNPNKENLFIWTNREKTICGLTFEQTDEYTTNKKEITCKTCKKK
jgi:hypothetical protein